MKVGEGSVVVLAATAGERSAIAAAMAGAVTEQVAGRTWTRGGVGAHPVVLVTGGGLQGQSLDVLAGLDGVRHFSFPTVQRAKIHGTGATFSAAVAASLSKGDSLREAILAAKLYVSAAISAAPSLDNGRSALWHSVTVREQVIATQSDEWPAVQVHQRSRAMTPLQGNPIIPPL